MNAEQEFEERLDQIKKMNKITIAKGITKMVVRHSVSAVAVTIVHSLVPKDVLNRNRKIQLYVAAWALGGVTADNASQWAATNVGEKLELIESLFKKVKDEPSETTWKEATEEPTE
jgi:hypothetical protein